MFIKFQCVRPSLNSIGSVFNIGLIFNIQIYSWINKNNSYTDFTCSILQLLNHTNMYKSPSCGLCVVFVWEKIGFHGGSHDLLTCRCTDERRSCYHCTICCYGYVCTILMFHLLCIIFQNLYAFRNLL